MKKYGRQLGISDYRFDNFPEKILGFWADRSETGKRLYVLSYQLFDRKYYLGGLERIEKQINAFESDASEKRKKSCAGIWYIPCIASGVLLMSISRFSLNY